MNTLNIHTPVGQLVAERPSRSRIFEQWGLDYCCGGKKPLEQACLLKGLDPQAILHSLEVSDAERVSNDQIDWSKATFTDLADHIETTHHAYLREALPRLSGLISKVVRAHGDKHPELAQVQSVFSTLREEMEAHTSKEELILFPMCRQLDSASVQPEFYCGSLQNPITVLEREHDGAGQGLEQLRALTHGYTPPEGACNTYRAMLDGLAELGRDLHTHVHKENNILFPRVIEYETQLTAI